MSNPTLTLEQCYDLASSKGITEKAVLIGLRWKGSVYGENDAYTDTLILLTPDGKMTYKLNTLPTKWSPGMACLEPGIWRFRKGLHGMHHLDLEHNADDKAAYEWLLAHVGQDHPDPKYALTYWAGREVPPMTVVRNGESGTHTDSVASPFWIDLHHGGLYTTSSEACQTVPVAIGHQVREAYFGAMDKYSQTEIPYILELVD